MKFLFVALVAIVAMNACSSGKNSGGGGYARPPTGQSAW
jgi:hypothetical protein